MPPRIQSKLLTNSLRPCLQSSSISHTQLLPSCRPFTSTPAAQTRLREAMIEWLNSEGQELKTHNPGVPNYLTGLRERRQNRLAQAAGDDSSADDSFTDRRPQPFPLNPTFVSESVLSEEMRLEIFRRVVEEKHSVREVSVDLGVDMRRIGAVVRLVELEKRWRKQQKPLALPYARVVHEMVPVTELEKRPNTPQVPHESINDLPAHRLTEPQIFYPASESRQFNRVDAGRVFSGAPALSHTEAQEITTNPTEATLRVSENPQKIERVGKGEDESQVLQPADVRIPHPHLIAYHRDRHTMSQERDEIAKRYQERLRRDQAARDARKSRIAKATEARTLHVQPENSRFEFRFQDVVVDWNTTGSDGRGVKAPGRRYGVPNYDRSKGQVKIPTKVQV